INKLDKKEELEIFFSDKVSTESEDDLYYNSWEDKSSLAIYLTEFMEGLNQDDQKISYNVGLKVTTKQQQEARELLVKNYDIITTDISKKGQTIG
ncbi:19204_t:CDS:1, partial [Racocetra persica]